MSRRGPSNSIGQFSGIGSPGSAMALKPPRSTSKSSLSLCQRSRTIQVPSIHPWWRMLLPMLHPARRRSPLSSNRGLRRLHLLTRSRTRLLPITARRHRLALSSQTALACQPPCRILFPEAALTASMSTQDRCRLTLSSRGRKSWRSRLRRTASAS